MNLKRAISADEALQRLIDGNERFLNGAMRISGPPVETMARLTRGQQPFATILGCSDSRVPPEWIFDAGLGELFVVRVAGNVLSPEVAGSLQYAGAHLHTPLFMVLGHEGCGAIQAALETKFHGVRQRSRIQLLVDGILPALQGVDPRLPPRKRPAQAVENNVRRTVQTILESPEGQARREEGRMKIVGAIYEIRTGRVRFLDESESASHTTSREAKGPRGRVKGGSKKTF
jgi:carbonic anhydrase